MSPLFDIVTFAYCYDFISWYCVDYFLVKHAVPPYCSVIEFSNSCLALEFATVSIQNNLEIRISSIWIQLGVLAYEFSCTIEFKLDAVEG